MLYTSRTPFPGWTALLPALGTVLALRACAQPDGTALTTTPLARILSIRPLQELGRLSYSWYLWHWPVLVFAAGLEFTEIHLLSPGYRAALVLLSLVLAEASYRFVENPVRHQKWLAALPRRGLALGLTMTLLSAGVFFGWKEMAQSLLKQPPHSLYVEASGSRINECIADIRSEDLLECTRGKINAEQKVLLFGDSHAHQWMTALDRLAEIQGFTLVTLMKSGCPVVFEPKFNSKLGRTYLECETWQQKAVQRIRDMKPDLILATSLVGNSFENAELQRGLDKAFSQLSELSISTLYLRDTPYPGFDVPACLARTSQPLYQWTTLDCTYPSDNFSFENAYQRQKETASKYANVEVLDINSAICDDAVCEVMHGSQVIFRDHSHLTASFAASLAPVLAPHIKARLAGTQADV